MDLTGGRIIVGFDNEPSIIKYEATQFQCNNSDCGAMWTTHTTNFIDKWKQDSLRESNIDSKNENAGMGIAFFTGSVIIEYEQEISDVTVHLISEIPHLLGVEDQPTDTSEPKRMTSA